MVDLLTAEELEEYNYFKSLVIPMLSKHGTKSMTYHDIKEKLEFLITKNCPKLWRATTAFKIFSMNSRANVFSCSYFTNNRRNLQ